MSERFRIDAVTDESEVKAIVARNAAKGYESVVEPFVAMRWNGSDLGGDVNVLEDPDGQGFLVIGRR